MAEQIYPYVIVGAGLAGASAVEGIREADPVGAILLIGGEKHFPYHRPPLSKGLWTGQEEENGLFVHDEAFYREQEVVFLPNTRITGLNVKRKLLTDESGRTYRFHKLLLATGGTPKLLPVPGGTLPEIRYFRTLDDYHALRRTTAPGKTALIFGGGFIGSELAASLALNQVHVTLLFPDPYLCSRVLPDYLGLTVQRHFQDRGISVLAGEKPVFLARRSGRIAVQTDRERLVEADLAVAGIGILPNTELAEAGGLKTSNGIVVNNYLQTSHPDVFAAGDNAEFEYPGLRLRLRLEHWDNALNQGRQAGRNMAGAHEPFTYQPYFFSELFDFNYEAVGLIDSRLQTSADWQDPNKTGVVYYLADRRIQGVMFCNMPDRIETARKLMNRQERIDLPQNLAGLIR